MRPAESLDYRLDRWAREAREFATCVACYGVGEDRDAPGRACPVCAGRGRAAREPHVIELVDLVRAQQAEAEILQARADRAEGAAAERLEHIRLEAAARRRSDELRLAAEDRADSSEATIATAAGRIVVAELEADQLRLEVDRLRVELYRLRDERQAARAEVERLRGIIEVNDQRLAAVWDEARAEVERLRDELQRARRPEGDD